VLLKVAAFVARRVPVVRVDVTKAEVVMLVATALVVVNVETVAAVTRALEAVIFVLRILVMIALEDVMLVLLILETSALELVRLVLTMFEIVLDVTTALELVRLVLLMLVITAFVLVTFVLRIFVAVTLVRFAFVINAVPDVRSEALIFAELTRVLARIVAVVMLVAEIFVKSELADVKLVVLMLVPSKFPTVIADAVSDVTAKDPAVSAPDITVSPPTLRFLPMPTPPATTTAPDAVLVL
jgi:hypothetical protein